MERNVRTAILLDLYGALLTEKQAEVLDLYCNDDLSLSEIAELTGVSRQAVHDAIAKGERILSDIEEKTKLGARIGELEARLLKIHKLAESMGDAELLRLSEIGE